MEIITTNNFTLNKYLSTCENCLIIKAGEHFPFGLEYFPRTFHLWLAIEDILIIFLLQVLQIFGGKTESFLEPQIVLLLLFLHHPFSILRVRHAEQTPLGIARLLLDQHTQILRPFRPDVLLIVDFDNLKFADVRKHVYLLSLHRTGNTFTTTGFWSASCSQPTRQDCRERMHPAAGYLFD